MSRVLVEQGDSWILPLDGALLQGIRSDQAVVLDVSNAGQRFEIRIEQQFQLRDPSGTVSWVEAQGDSTALDEAIEPFRTHILGGIAHKDGALELRLSEGVEIWVAPDPDYEAWTVAGDSGLKIVALPGGELAVWREEET